MNGEQPAQEIGDKVGRWFLSSKGAKAVPALQAGRGACTQ